MIFYFIFTVLTLLCDIGQLIPIIDTKSTAEIWKCISKLSTENSRDLIVESPQINKEYLRWRWLYKSNKFLCNEIYEGIIDIITNVIYNYIIYYLIYIFCDVLRYFLFLLATKTISKCRTGLKNNFILFKNTMQIRE